MTALDEKLRRELERIAEPADPAGVSERVLSRSARRSAARRVQPVALGFVVVVGSILGVAVLSRVFTGAPAPAPADDGAAARVSNGAIVFSEVIDLEEHLFRVSPDGTNEEQLTPEGAATYRSPDVSPDGRTIVAVHRIPSFRQERSVLVTVPIEGGSPTWLLDEPGLIAHPAWSPDGRRIAFAGSLGGPYGIHVFDAGSGDVELIPRTDEISVAHPTWSADGSRIAFQGSDADGRDPVWDIYTVGLDGSEPTNLTRTPVVSETGPAWSWTADRIAFVELGPAEGALLTMAPDGTDVTVAFSGELAPANPAWSPDGASIVFEGGSEGLFSVDAGGGDAARLTASGAREPAWQPVPNIDGDLGAPETAPRETSGEPKPIGDRDDPVRIDGVPFLVCDVDAIGWASGGDGLGQAFTFEEAPAGGCDAAVEGRRYVGVTRQPAEGIHRIDAYYGPVTRCLEPTGCWLYASVELDGDPPEELLLGTDGSPSRVEVRLVDVAVSGKTFRVQPFELVCDDVAACVSPFEPVLDWTEPGLSGLACGMFADGSYVETGIYVWHSRSSDSFEYRELLFQSGTVRYARLAAVVNDGHPLDEFPPSDASQVCLRSAFVAPSVLAE